ncbi:MAG: hypothetical protein KDI90_02735 [Alphaproteobacteria bacterium]|nr:hypothetical protein [Alphaproteobacteria bacterium]MCB9974993.1 hypothetical protein [Rhodospirillales bacterium]
MKDKLLSLVKDIHYALDQTRIFSIHTHRPYIDEKGVQRFTNMGVDDQIAKDRINKLISDCGKMKDHVDACQSNLGYVLLNGNKLTLTVLHDLCNRLKHPATKKNYPFLGDIQVTRELGASLGGHADIIVSSGREKTCFWDITGQSYACIRITAEVLDDQGKSFSELASLVKDSLKIWVSELKKNSIQIPDYVELDPIKEAAKYGQHGSLFVETYDDALAKASILTSERRFNDAAVLYNYALTKCENDEQRAHCYGCLELSYEDAREFVLAQSCYYTALRYSPTMKGLHVNFGNMCDRLGDIDGAKTSYHKELELPHGDHESAKTNLLRYKK